MSLFLVTEFAAYVFVRTFRFYTTNVHYNLVLPIFKIIIHTFERFLFRQRNDEQPAGAKWAGREQVNARLWIFLFKKNNGLPTGAEKKSQEHSKGSIDPSVLKSIIPPDSKQGPKGLCWSLCRRPVTQGVWYERFIILKNNSRWWQFLVGGPAQI
jgi:hypothetical protein